MNVEDDRLRVLPDDLILKILSFVGLKDAIGTSVLSPRWRYVWTPIPHLSFSSEDFSTIDKFSNVVTHVLPHRNNEAHLSSFKLYIRAKDGQDVALRIMNRALFLSVQQLNIKCLFGKITGIPLSLSGSQTRTKVCMSTKVKNYLLNSSPNATLTEVLRNRCCDVGAGACEDSV